MVHLVLRISAIAAAFRALLPAIALTCAMGQPYVVLEDSRARATTVEIPQSGTYTLQSNAAKGSVWVALEDARFVITDAGVSQNKTVSAGDTGKVPPGNSVQFQNEKQGPARLIIVDVKTSLQDLTVQAFSISGSLLDASDRNETLIIALAPLRLRDVWNTGNESRWRPSKPEIIRMGAGDVRWIRPGIHHFSNQLRTLAKFVFIEW